MSWVKLDDRFTENEKVEAISDAAFRLHVTALCRCARNETDGKIITKTARAIGTPRHIKELVEARLWLVIEDGYEIKDYLKYNPSHAQLEAKREATRERLKRHRDGSEDDVSDDECNGVTSSVTDGVQNASGNGVANTSPLPLPLSDLPPSSYLADQDQPVSLGSPRARASQSQRKRPSTAIPEDFAFNERHAAMAKKHGYPEWWVRSRVERFIDLSKAKDWRYVDWDSAFRNFLKGEIEWKRGPDDLAHLAPKFTQKSTGPTAADRERARVAAERERQAAQDALSVGGSTEGGTRDVKTLLTGIGGDA